jgi:three-Cys-motif partner protein
MADEPLIVPPDGLYTPEIKPHSVEKIHLHNQYAHIFAAAMARSWPQLAYIGLYAGAGRGLLSDTHEHIETSALAVLRQQPRFTDYVYVDNKPACVAALTERVRPLRGTARITIIPGDVNESIPLVRDALPPFSRSRGLLSFCFVDPFDLQLRFSTIRALADLRVDFLILLMLGVDGRRNFRTYLEDSASTRIGDLIDDPNWRHEYKRGTKPIHFLLTKFDQAMQGLGYPSAASDVHPIKVTGKGVFLYVLAFYSKSAAGRKFWSETRRGTAGQFSLGI